MSEFIVVQTHPNMLIYIDMLQKKNAEALSFYPKQVFEREQEKGRLFLGLLNGEPCGYLYVGATGKDVKCHQVCIEYDARRKLYGAQLIAVMEDYAIEGNSSSITLRCGFDLDANQFWKDMGYNVIMHQTGGVRRMRTINIWRKQLTPELFENIALEPAVGKTNSTLWRKNKQTGIISSFNRGKKINEYRALIIGKDGEPDAP
jgi:GNAT superfamily N-acetyltransferase